MVDDDEEVSLTLKREFGEETMNSLVLSEEEKANCEASLQDFFKNGRSVYRGAYSS
jgi:ADP-ribose pyrophosphatase